MNRKITGLLIAIISAFFITYVIAVNKCVKFESFFITQSDWNKIIETRSLSEELKLNYLKFNGYELILDSSSNKWYYSLTENSPLSYNPTVLYDVKDNKLKLSILEKKISSDLIENSEEISFIIYNDYEYNTYSIVCTTLPLMNITYDDGLTITEDKKIDMSMFLFDNRKNATQRVITSNGTIYVRGATSSSYPKKGFKISLINESIGGNDRDNNISLLGMRQDDDWILYAGYNDQEKIRNVFSSNLWYKSCALNNSFSISNGMEYKYVELFLNNEYWGLYALGFPIDEKQLNLNSSDNNYDEYIFKKINWDSSDINILENTTKQLMGYKLVNKLKSDDIAWQQLRNYYTKLVTSKNKDELYSIVDINNLIDYYLFNNLIQGADNANENALKNVYITFKKSNEQYIALYTPWDLDLTFGNMYSFTEKNYTVSYGFNSKTNIVGKTNSIYYLQQLGDENINLLIKNRYKELRNSYWSNEYILNLLNDYEVKIYNSGAFIRDMNKWPDGTYNDSNTKLNDFRNYVLERLIYMDEFVNSME